jgi:hypothetical protein
MVAPVLDGMRGGERRDGLVERVTLAHVAAQDGGGTGAGVGEGEDGPHQRA